MGRFSAGGTGVTNLPTTKRGPSIHAPSDHAIKIREISVWNTTTTAFAVAVMRVTAAGTRVDQITVEQHDPASLLDTATVYLSHSADATIADLTKRVRNARIPAAIGAGVIWTFGDNGLVVPAGTANGLVLTCPTGTAQFFDFDFTWDPA